MQFYCQTPVGMHRNVWQYVCLQMAVLTLLWRASASPSCNVPVTEWRHVQAEGLPSARSGALTATTPSGQVWMFGGWDNDAGKTLNDLWTQKPDAQLSWKNVTLNKETRPSPRYLGHACCFQEKFVIFGGTEKSEATWMFNMTSATWSKVKTGGDTPKPRMAGATWCVGDKMYIYGGYKKIGEVLSDMWVLSLDKLSWQSLGNQIKLGGRLGAMSWTDSKEENLYLFGGRTTYIMNIAQEDLAKQYKNDMWVFPIKTRAFSQFSPGSGSKEDPAVGHYGNQNMLDFTGLPGGRTFSATWRDTCDRLWMFAGQGLGEITPAEPGVQSDLWFYDIPSRSWFSSGGFQMANVYASEDGATGQSNVDNFPGSRWMANTWTQGDQMYLFSGNYRDGEQSKPVRDIWQITFKAPPPNLPATHLKNTRLTYVKVYVPIGLIITVAILIFVLRKLVKASPKEKFANVKYKKLMTDIVSPKQKA